VNVWFTSNVSFTVLFEYTVKLSTPRTTLVPSMSQNWSGNVSVKFSCEWNTAFFAAVPVPAARATTTAAIAQRACEPAHDVPPLSSRPSPASWQESRTSPNRLSSMARCRLGRLRSPSPGWYH
jgi:hypothetical protein